MNEADAWLRRALPGVDTRGLHTLHSREELPGYQPASGLPSSRHNATLRAGIGEVRVIESGRVDKYRRTLAHVEVDGVDVGEILIREGLARPYHGERRKSWCE